MYHEQTSGSAASDINFSKPTSPTTAATTSVRHAFTFSVILRPDHDAVSARVDEAPRQSYERPRLALSRPHSRSSPHAPIHPAATVRSQSSCSAQLAGLAGGG